MLNGSGEEGDGDCIRYQPDIGLTREDAFEIHRLLEALGVGDARLAALGTIVNGKRPVAEAAMGIQYLFSNEDLRIFADAYRRMTPDDLARAIEQIRPDFDPQFFAFMPKVGPERFEVIRTELAKVADNNWAMIGGMF